MPSSRPRRRHRAPGPSSFRPADLVRIGDKHVVRRRKPWWMRLRRLVQR